MNEKVRNIVLLLALIVVLIIFVDLIFNFSGLMVEKFTVSSSYNSQTQTSQEGSSTQTPTEIDDNNLDHTNIKSVRSMVFGKMFKINFLQNDPENNTILLESPVSSNANVSANTDATLSEELKTNTNIAQHFKLLKIDNAQKLNDLLKDTNNGAHTSSAVTKYPFYVIKSLKFGDNNWCLSYEPGRIFLSPLGNYDNQKWDVSNIEVLKKGVLTHTVTNTDDGNFNAHGDGSDGQLIDPDKIKINLNLTDELKRQLLGVESNQNSSGRESQSNDFYSQTCDSHIPKNALKSLCRGCDPSKL
jgi:hypothetical protein